MQIIGTVLRADLQFLPDGSAVIVGLIRVTKPSPRDLYFYCFGATGPSCQGQGRRQLDGYLLPGDGEAWDEDLNLVIVTKVKK